MISNNIEELREHKSLTENDLENQMNELKLSEGKITVSQSFAIASTCVDHIETITAIMLTELESSIETEDTTSKESEADKNNDKYILKVIKENKVELCNRLCMLICKDWFSDMFGETTVKPLPFFDDPEKLSEKMAHEMLRLINEFAKREEK